MVNILLKWIIKNTHMTKHAKTYPINWFQNMTGTSKYVLFKFNKKQSRASAYLSNMILFHCARIKKKS